MSNNNNKKRAALKPRTSFITDDEAFEKDCESTELLLHPQKGGERVLISSKYGAPSSRAFDDLTNADDVAECYRRAWGDETAVKKRAMPFDATGGINMYACVIAVLVITQIIVSVASNGKLGTWASLIYEVVMLAAAISFAAILKYRKNFFYFKCEKTKKNVTALSVIVPLLCAVVLFFGSYLLVEFYTELIFKTGLPREAAVIKLDSAADVWGLIISTVFVAPAVEESIFRGVLFHSQKERFGIVYSIFINALLFMLMHMNILQTLFQFMVGLVSAYLVYKSRRCFCGVLFHAGCNALAVTAMLTPLGTYLTNYVMFGLHNAAYMVIVSIILVAAALAIIYFVGKIAFKRESYRAPEVIAALPVFSAPVIVHRQDGFNKYRLRQGKNQSKITTAVMGTACLIILIANWIALAVSM